jgi:hypothetical protein
VRRGARRPGENKVAGWPRIRKLARAFLWKYSYKRLKLVQILGQHGVLLARRPLPPAAITTVVECVLTAGVAAARLRTASPASASSRTPSSRCTPARRTVPRRARPPLARPPAGSNRQPLTGGSSSPSSYILQPHHRHHHCVHRCRATGPTLHSDPKQSHISHRGRQASLDMYKEFKLRAKRPVCHQARESTLLYVLSHTTPHTNLHINKSTEA